MAESTVVPVAATQSVIVIEGMAYVRNATGGLVQLKPGDPLLDGQTLITDAQGFAKLQLPNGEIIDIGPNREVRFDTEMASMPPVDKSEASVASAGTVSDQILGALEQGIDVTTALEPAAAGLIGGPGGADEGHGFVRLLRIVENVSPLAFNFEAAVVDEQELMPLSDPDIVAPTTANEAPTTDDKNVSGDEDGEPIAITLTGADLDGTVASFTINSLPENGTLLYNGNPVTVGQVIPAAGNSANLSFVPDENWNGDTSFQYASTDNEGLDDATPATVDITVNSVNDLPDAVNDSYEVDEDGVLTVTPAGVLGNDSIGGDGGTLAVTSFTQPSHGTLTQNANGGFTYTPDANYFGADSYTYTITDANGDTDTATVSITVNPIGDPPVATDNLNSIAEDTVPPVTGNMINDNDGFGVDSDVDAGAVLHVSAVTGGNAYGTLTWYSDGT